MNGCSKRLQKLPDSVLCVPLAGAAGGAHAAPTRWRLLLEQLVAAAGHVGAGGRLGRGPVRERALARVRKRTPAAADQDVACRYGNAARSLRAMRLNTEPVLVCTTIQYEYLLYFD